LLPYTCIAGKKGQLIKTLSNWSNTSQGAGP
jgi:hypothetical protein